MIVSTRRCFGEEVGAVSLVAVRSYLSRGDRLVLFEGLPGAGKTTALSEVAAAGFRSIDLDDFIAKEADEQVTWNDHVVRGGALDAIRRSLAAAELVCAGGAAAWPVLQPVIELERLPVARIYLKRIYTAGEFSWWDDGDGLAEHAERSPPYFKAIYAHHAADRPWENADLVIERVRRSDEN